ncbi:oligosaccharide flippase family protein [Plantactinospora siamensis]|uniref:Oligosaccharide flippase family protein n=1 Tax=Plantactinospora siamensis TaxID=555372 RepID=A0ABV6P441_9ACTN
MASLRVGIGWQVARSTGSLLASRAVVAVATLVSLPIVYDGLGAHEFGVWALLGVLATLFTLIDLGLGPAQIREVARAHDAAGRRYARASLGLGLLCGVALGVAAIVVTLAGWPLLARLFHIIGPAQQAREAALWLMVGVLADQVSVPWRAMLAGTQRYTAVAVVTGLCAVLTAVLAVLVIRLGGGLAALGATTAATNAIRTILLIAVAQRKVRSLTPSLRRIRRSDVRSVLGYGLPVQLTKVAGTGTVALSPLVVGGVFGPAAVGGFDLAGRLLSLLRLPADLLFTVLFPVTVAQFARHGRQWIDEFYHRFTGYVTAFAAPSAAAMVVCAEPLVRFWMGHDVPWAAGSIAILAPGYALGLVIGVATLVTRTEGKPGRETASLIVALVVNVALIYPMMRLCGPLGAATSTLVAIVISTVGFFLQFHRATHRPVLPLLRAAAPGTLASVLAATAGWLAAPHLPDLAGRWGAGVTTACRGTVVLVVGGAVLAATQLLDPAVRPHAWPRPLRARRPAVGPVPGVPAAARQSEIERDFA